VKSDSVPICTETFFIFQEILRAKSDAGASMQFDRRPMALPYPYGRRLKEDPQLVPRPRLNRNTKASGEYNTELATVRLLNDFAPPFDRVFEEFGSFALKIFQFFRQHAVDTESKQARPEVLDFTLPRKKTGRPYPLVTLLPTAGRRGLSKKPRDFREWTR
jgi:hypothetical protein